MRKPVYAICEQQRRRSACASASLLFAAYVIGCFGWNKYINIVFVVSLFCFVHNGVLLIE